MVTKFEFTVLKVGKDMIFDFGRYSVEIDVNKTKQFYEKARLISQDCSCDGCQNYELAFEYLPDSVKTFFDTLGVDYKRACECYVNTKNSDGTLLYGGFYHICGTVLSGSSAWVEKNNNSSFWDENLTYKIDDGFQVSFQNVVYALEEGFPDPVIQLEFLAIIPWVLNRECPY